MTGGGDTFSIALFCDPVPASRPRVTRWGTYYGKTYKNWRELAAVSIPHADFEPLEGPLSVETLIYVRKPKTTKRKWPRGDVDNYEKAIFDAVTNAGYWHDDDQIILSLTHKRYAEDYGVEPHIHITAEVLS